MEIIEKLYVDEVEFVTPLDLLLWMIPGHCSYFQKCTYYDKECTNLQDNSYRRSFDDLYVLFKTYFPDITEKELLKTLEEGEMSVYFCGDINRIVFHRIASTFANIERYIKNDEVEGFYSDKAKNNNYTKYSYKDFIRILEEN